MGPVRGARRGRPVDRGRILEAAGLAVAVVAAVVAAVAGCGEETAGERARGADGAARDGATPGAGGEGVAPASGMDGGAAVPFPEVDGSGVEYVLLLGFDGPLSPPGRTDAILIVALDFDREAIGIVSVPRDLWVEIPGFDPGRINKVYRIGDNFLGRGAGHRLLKDVIARELGIRVRSTVAVDMRGFEEIVDVLGGVQVDIDCPIKDNFVSPDAPSGYEPLALEAGRQKLDGRTALLYSRSRHGRSDLDRARRQQAVLAGMWRRIARFDTLGRLPSLWEKIVARVRTDIELEDAVRYAALAHAASGEGVHGLVLHEPTVYQWRSPEGQSVLKLDRSKLRADLAHLFDAPKPGKRLEAMCRPEDAALHWKERRPGAAASDDDDEDAPRAPDAGL